jgi:Leucine-rich repeat (LRR) protein
MDGCVQPLPHSLQTFVITDSDPHMVLDLSNMKELRILICDGIVSLTSIPQNLRCLCDIDFLNKDGYISRQNFPRVPRNNQLAFLRWSCRRPTYDLLETFQRLTKLETLKLEFSNYVLGCSEDEDILELNFEKLYMLQDISLSWFNKKTISGFSSKHRNLRYLKLVSCLSLRSCPSVGDLLALEELVIVNCSELEELPNLQQLTRLRKLSIRYCKSIVAVPGLGNLVALEEFIASSCDNLVALPDMHKLTNLQTLDLGYSHSLKEVPGLCELIALQMLDIEHEALQGGSNLHKLNKLVTLGVRNWSGPPAFSDVVSLEHLRIQNSGEGIEMMPNLLHLARLQSVRMRYCNFKDVSCLGDLISLQSISINVCDSLETLFDVHKLTRLETLEVEMCPDVKVWPGVSRSKSLDTLWVDQPRSGTTMALRALTLSDTDLTELPDLSLFPGLKKLEIRLCSSLERLISTMPMTALERLEIYNCPELQEVPDLSHCKLLSYCEIWWCEKISLTRDEITKLEAMVPGLKIHFRPY